MISKYLLTGMKARILWIQSFSADYKEEKERGFHAQIINSYRGFYTIV